MQRARFGLLAVYVALAVAGVIFMYQPANSVTQITDSQLQLMTWSLFYLCGGLTCAAAMIARIYGRGRIATWFFELAGLALLISATLVYFAALIELTRVVPSAAGGTATVILAFAISLGLRAYDTYKTMKLLRTELKKVSPAEEGGDES